MQLTGNTEVIISAADCKCCTCTCTSGPANSNVCDVHTAAQAWPGTAGVASWWHLTLTRWDENGGLCERGRGQSRREQVCVVDWIIPAQLIGLQGAGGQIRAGSEMCGLVLQPDIQSFHLLSVWLDHHSVRSPTLAFYLFLFKFFISVCGPWRIPSVWITY